MKIIEDKRKIMERIWIAKCKRCGKSYKRNTRHSKLCSECRDKIYKKRNIK